MPIVRGYNGDIDAGTETVVPAGGLWLPPTAARVHAVVSGSANDAAAGTGARTLLLTGILASGAESSEIITLNGTTPVNSSGSYIHVTSLEVLTAGSGGVNAGIITATAATDSTVTCSMHTGDNRSSGALLFAARPGDQFQLREVHVATAVHGAATVSHQAFLALGSTRAGSVVRRLPLTATYSGATTAFTLPVEAVLQQGEWARVDVTSSAANTVVFASINYKVS